MNIRGSMAQVSLFRTEVFEARRTRLHGDVILTRSTSSWALLALLMAIVLAAAVWVVAGRYARTEQAMGRIVPDGALTRIMPTRPGVIVKLAVHEGDAVKAGQPLATVLVEQASADRADPVAEDLGSLDRQHALINQQIDLSHRAQAGDVAKLASNITEFKAEIAALDSQIALQRDLIQSTRASFEPLTEITNKGFYSRIQYEQKRQQFLGSQVQLAQLEAQRAQLSGQLRGAEVSLGVLPTQTASRVNDLMTSQATLVQKRIELENGRSYVITAPVAGRVSALQVSQGSTISSQMPLMSIVNSGARMTAELFAPSRAIGFARPGQEVRLMYDAFPYQRFGSFSGHITEISRTVLAPNEVEAGIQTKEPVYRIRVALTEQSVSAFGEHVPLQPGMSLQANIVLDRRSFLDWLMEPINAVRNRA